MATTCKWATPEALTTGLSTELNSIPTGTAAISSAISNGTDLYTHLNAELSLATINLASAVNAGAYLWLLSSLDGTNYEDGGTGSVVQPARTPDAVFSLRSISGAQVTSITNVPLPPLNFKFLLQNGTSAAFAAADNILKYRRHNLQSV